MVASQPEMFSVAEAIWASQTDYDVDFLPKLAEEIRPFANSFSELTTFMANFNARRNLDTTQFSTLAQAVVDSSKSVSDTLNPFTEKLKCLLKESQDFVRVVQTGELKDVRRFLEGTQHLSRGACGVRHVDFIAYKPEGDNEFH